MSSRAEIWSLGESGVLTPTGYVDDTNFRKSSKLHEVRLQAHRIEEIFSAENIPISPTCGLYQAVSRAKEIGERALNSEADVFVTDIFEVLAFDRLAESIVTLDEAPNRAEYLRKMTSGELDPFIRKKSHAKDIFWEIELWSILRRNHAAAALEDPPDILVPLDHGTLGISCKKIYSERNVEKVISNAVHQVEGSFDAGVIALNIDELVPKDSVLKVNSERIAYRKLRHITELFLQNHQRYFRKYLSTGRTVAAMVCVNVIADIEGTRSQFNNARSAVIWAIPGLQEKKMLLLEEFRKLILYEK